MISRFWTAFLISLACASTIAWLVALMHEKDIRPTQDLVAFFKKQSKAGRVLLGTFFIAMWIIASTKPGDGGGNGGGGGGNGGTNNIQMVIGIGGELGNVANVEMLPISITNSNFTVIDSHQGQLTIGNIGTGNNLTMATLTTSTNTTRALDGDDFRRGFVMYRIGTDEQFDFSAPSNATVCADWEAFGAATDWIYVSFTNWAFQVGTNEINRMRIHSDGWVEMRNCVATTQFWPLRAVYLCRY